mgnify:CR=1 FL=1
MILETTGDLWLDGIGVSTCLPYVRICSSLQSKAVFGVLATTENQVKGYINSGLPIKNEEKYVGVNSIGEGKIWVTNINGPCENGDYITGSVVAGYGQLQDDDILHSYTVAKLTQNIDWDAVTETVNYEGNSYKKYLAGCAYHCG